MPWRKTRTASGFEGRHGAGDFFTGSQVSLAQSLIGQGRYDEAEPLVCDGHTALIAVYGNDAEMIRVLDGMLAEIERARAGR